MSIGRKISLNIKKIVYYYFDVFHIRGKKSSDKYNGWNEPSYMDFENSKYRIGIIKEQWNLHYNYVKACRELKISYILLDILKENWLEDFDNEKFDFLIARPSVQHDEWKNVYDYRLKLLEDSRHFKIFPDLASLWLWESKLKTIDWLKVNNYPIPKTFIFYNMSESLDFVEKYKGFLVYKSNSGSGSSGVKILKTKRQKNNQIRKCFKRGVRTYRKHKLDKEHGFVILQEYIENLCEWRIIRIGDYYFGFQKIKKGEFHSGSGEFGYGMPPEECLNFVRELTTKNKFFFVDIDVFITTDNKILVNEIQPYFGQKGDRELLVIDNICGRLKYEESWLFEKGEYCKNNLSNLRLAEIIKIMDKQGNHEI